MTNDKKIEDCSHHKKEVAGISDMKVLAEMIGDLHYESLAELLKLLRDKIYDDGRNDYHNGRYELSKNLFEASGHLYNAQSFIVKAWQISKPFMEKQKQ